VPPVIAGSDPLWYKDAIIYQAHVRAFYDGNGDGVGDFIGLTEKLDYIANLGVSAIWLLPFYPSPLRDDGYDIAHYEGVHPSYGGVRDVRRFLREAHERGLRVITELVINHTSDQHPWFQAARRAAAGSRKRDYYVWSETPAKYPDVRIIFKDAEPSNWSWDSVAQAYYWHRFFSHQPDLNFDNPRVLRALLKVLHFWMDMGVDGMRLDAVPYLVEREGTVCENLPETHAILKRIRHELDARYPGRMLLAEANQWPADVRPYFGDGDESHMAFHFPLMPRLFMAVRQEDRYPIVDVLRQTPDIPESCQWATFLRNHDELTLEMVSDEERDYMWAQYAADPMMRINMGIRRRLAPLVENHRDRIELLTALLFSLPGTPVIYYGDEIGMGDNVYLGDRNTVRTPMQWSGDRNGGFSRADPARLYLPPVMDAVYGYQAVNVESQERSPFSLLNWMRRLIAVRLRHRTFGYGTIDFLEPDNARILAFIREHDGERLLIVANLARSAQPAALDLARFDGLLPIELLDHTEFPRITTAPYVLTLGPYSFYWFMLVDPATLPSAGLAVPPPPVAERQLPALMVGPDWDRLLDSDVRTLIERRYLRPFLARQHWFTREIGDVESARFEDWITLVRGAEPLFLAVIAVRLRHGDELRYTVPLLMVGATRAAALSTAAPDRVLGRITGRREGVLCEAPPSDLALPVARPIVLRQTLATARGALAGDPEPGSDLTIDLVQELGARTAEPTPAHNAVAVLGDRMVLKLLRGHEPGPHPEVTIPRELARAVALDPARPPARTPRLFGSLVHGVSGHEPAVVAVLRELLPFQRSAWDQAVDALAQSLERVVGLGVPDLPEEGRLLDRGALASEERRRAALSSGAPETMRDFVGAFLNTASVIGARTAALHLALARSDAPGFGIGDDGPDYFTAIERSAGTAWNAARELASARVEALPARAALLLQDIVEAKTPLSEQLATFGARARGSTLTIRIHGDLNLTEILLYEADAQVIDFEGDPMRPPEWRRQRHSPLRDVATLMLSTAQASHAGLATYSSTRPTPLERLEPWARAWRRWSNRALLLGYLDGLAGSELAPIWGEASGAPALALLIAEQALQDLVLALRYRSDRLIAPLETLESILWLWGEAGVK
jgi:maltose alpha-D-glucosyltransferase/alpha-amylase